MKEKLIAALKNIPGILASPFVASWQWFASLFHEEFVLDVWFVAGTTEDKDGVKTFTRSRKQFVLTAITKKTQTHIIGKDQNGHPFEIKTVDPFDYTITKVK